ncbi:MAG: hypothetical protein ACLRWQ_17575 [Flavonifractor plautii]
MDGKYTRLKLKMLLLVVLGTLIAGAWASFCWRWWWTACSRTPLPGFSSGRPPGAVRPEPGGGALELYQRYIRNNKPEILTWARVLPMLIAFYLAMGRFTRWLDEIRSATRPAGGAQSGEASGAARELAPHAGGSECHPAAAPRRGRRRPGRASSASGIWWPSWPTISRPR